MRNPAGPPLTVVARQRERRASAVQTRRVPAVPPSRTARHEHEHEHVRARLREPGPASAAPPVQVRLDFAAAPRDGLTALALASSAAVGLAPARSRSVHWARGSSSATAPTASLSLTGGTSGRVWSDGMGGQGSSGAKDAVPTRQHAAGNELQLPRRSPAACTSSRGRRARPRPRPRPSPVGTAAQRAALRCTARCGCDGVAGAAGEAGARRGGTRTDGTNAAVTSFRRPAAAPSGGPRDEGRGEANHVITSVDAPAAEHSSRES